MDPWVRHWFGRARQLVADADGLVGVDRWEQACETYLQAVDLCALSLRGCPSGPDLRHLDDLCVTAFRAAVPLLPHGITVIGEAVGPVRIHGYLVAPRSPVVTSGLPAVVSVSAADVVYVVDRQETPEAVYREVVVPAVDRGLVTVTLGTSPAYELLDDWSRRAVLGRLLTPTANPGQIVRLPCRPVGPAEVPTRTGG